MKSPRKLLAAALTDWFYFARRHPAAGFAVSALLLAALAGAYYLLIVNFRSLTDLSCFRGGGCGN